MKEGRDIFLSSSNENMINQINTLPSKSLKLSLGQRKRGYTMLIESFHGNTKTGVYAVAENVRMSSWCFLEVSGNAQDSDIPPFSFPQGHFL